MSGAQAQCLELDDVFPRGAVHSWFLVDQGCVWDCGNCEARSVYGNGCVARRPPAVISQDEKDAEKAALRAVDARPIKKVAEAKARKRKRTQVGLLHETVSTQRDALHVSCP